MVEKPADESELVMDRHLMTCVLGLNAEFSLIPPGFQPFSDFAAVATWPVLEGFRWVAVEFAEALGGGHGRRWDR